MIYIQDINVRYMAVNIIAKNDDLFILAVGSCAFPGKSTVNLFSKETKKVKKTIILSVINVLLEDKKSPFDPLESKIPLFLKRIQNCTCTVYLERTKNPP